MNLLFDYVCRFRDHETLETTTSRAPSVVLKPQYRLTFIQFE
jgi:hypothetical protein